MRQKLELPVNTAYVDPSWTVLDMCAAPGGETAQLSNRLTDGVLASGGLSFIPPVLFLLRRTKA